MPFGWMTYLYMSVLTTALPAKNAIKNAFFHLPSTNVQQKPLLNGNNAKANRQNAKEEGYHHGNGVNAAFCRRNRLWLMSYQEWRIRMDNGLRNLQITSTV